MLTRGGYRMHIIHVAMVLGAVYVLGRSIAWWQRGAKRVQYAGKGSS